MREDFLPRIVGRVEAHDVARAIADIDVVVLIEDDVFRPVDAVKPIASTGCNRSFSA